MSKIVNTQLSFSSVIVSVLLVLIVFCLAGCSSPILQTYPGPAKTPENSAIVLVSSDPPSALTVQQINGKTYPNHKPSKDAINAEIHMFEGYHKLLLIFTCNVDGTNYSPQTFEIENTFNANCVYQIRSWTFKPDNTSMKFTFSNRQAWVELVELGDPALWGPVIASIDSSSDIWEKYPKSSTVGSTFAGGIIRKNESHAHIKKGREILCSFGDKTITKDRVFRVKSLFSESKLLFEMPTFIFEQPSYYQYREPHQYKPINIPKVHPPPMPKLPPLYNTR